MNSELLSAALLARGVLRRKSEDYLNWSAEDQFVLSALDIAVEAELDSLLGSRGDVDWHDAATFRKWAVRDATTGLSCGCAVADVLSATALLPPAGGGE